MSYCYFSLISSLVRAAPSHRARALAARMRGGPTARMHLESTPCVPLCGCRGKGVVLLSDALPPQTHPSLRDQFSQVMVQKTSSELAELVQEGPLSLSLTSASHGH